MTRTLRNTIVALALLAASLAALDLSRPRYQRLSIRALASLGELTGVTLVSDPYRASTKSQIRAYSIADPDSIQDPCGHPTAIWRDVQAGQFVVLGPLNIALVSPGCTWLLAPDEFFTEFEKLNQGASALPDASHPIPRFLCLQYGGGVEGLLRQVLLTSDGQLVVWDLPDWACSPPSAKLPSPAEADIPGSTVDRIFSLASGAGLSSKSTIEWSSNVLDGGVLSIAYSDGLHLGRTHFTNSVGPSGATRLLADEIQRLADAALDQRP